VATTTYEAKITPASGGAPLVVTVEASNFQQATRMIEAEYGPVKNWWSTPKVKQ